MCVQAEAGAASEPENPTTKYRRSLEIHTRFGSRNQRYQHRPSAEALSWQASKQSGEGRNGTQGMDSRLCSEDDGSPIYRKPSNLSGLPGQ
jgi:hypothetical protein